jgi:chromosome segregation ATPase
MSTISDAELEALHSRLATLEREKASRPTLNYADWSEAIRRAQIKRSWENQARATAGAEARALEMQVVGKELGRLEARLRKDQIEHNARREQHDRAGVAIDDEYEKRYSATRVEIKELRSRVDAAQAQAEASPVNAVVPELPPMGIDNSYMEEIAQRPVRLEDGSLVNPVTREVVGRVRR